ncbi:MAG TPA: right-handed parallel beta-helix repeat-containing protein [Anaerohalosphaeraceae bacterium]|nr:right-handed parallel beta-helix repeat-containing protein [Anaerohalosphaeraceae bacterium]HRT49366.1 right-handed parallel beta-helix repeat-containing protein [Anaerohalosphaeraceae bacterium]HRT85905.1 right-handed parallel beta-helix repeat-containing protein [Anaerohalosphaeraceae bacterium]
MKSRLFCAIAVFLSLCGIATSATLMVAADGSGDYTTIQAALDAAVGGVDEVLVADGTYTGPGNRDLTFGGKAIVLKSIGGPANCIIDCQGLGRAFVFASGEGSGTVVDGFTIVNGYHSKYGGAIECDGSSPTIYNCVITNCSSYDGGAIDCFAASPVIAYCELTGNHAVNSGGAIKCYPQSEPTITDCRIEGSTAGYRGGGIDCRGGSPLILNCMVLGNAAGYRGGGIACFNGSMAKITNCLLAGNLAGEYGGAIDCSETSQPAIAYCTVVDNMAGEEDEGFGGVYADVTSVLTTVTSCILWNNGDDLEGCPATYSCIQDGDPGEGNIDEDPQFRTGALGDYYLRQTAAGQLANSPCVNAGKPDLSLVEFAPGDAVFTTRTDNGPDADVPDMGYHFTNAGPVEEFSLVYGVVPDSEGHDNGTVEVRGEELSRYRKWSEVALWATPEINADGYEVEQWHGLLPEDIVSSPTSHGVTVTMTQDRDVRVEFQPWPMFVLTLEVVSGQGTVGTAFGAPTGEPGKTYQYGGRMAAIEAQPADGYQVRFWTGTDDDVYYTGQDIANVTMLSDKTVTVEFVRDDIVKLDVQVIGEVNGWVDPDRGLYTYVEGEEWPKVVNLTAYPEAGYRVKRWTGTDDDALTTPTNTVTMNWDKLVTVEFEPTPLHQLFADVYAADGVIHGSVDPNSGIYYEGEVVHLVATADPGWEVRRWYVNSMWDPTGVTDEHDVIIQGDTHVQVEFRRVGMAEGTITLNGDDTNPFPTIQAAIDAAQDGDEVVVARGVYSGPGNVDLDVLGTNFAGEPNSMRSIVVRSELGPEETIIECGPGERGFIFRVPVNNAFRVEGFTVRNGGGVDEGGAIWIGADPDADPPVAATPIIENCIFEMNRARVSGGAIYITGVGADDAVEQDAEDAEYAEIRNCIIRNNWSMGDGGGIYVTNGASPRIVNTQILDNYASAYGAGLFSNGGSLPAVINCLFTGNMSGDIGGAIYLNASNAIIRLCTIVYNYGLDYGDMDGDHPIGPKGGIAAEGDADPEINHCIIGFSGSPTVGYGIWGDPLYWGDDLFGCEAEYSCIENGDGGDNNIRGNPLFVTGPLGDFYLSQTRSGQRRTSPCVDAGEDTILGDLRDQYDIGQDITTAILNLRDVGDGDLGYHYPVSTGPPMQHRLDLQVVGNGHMLYEYYGDMGAEYGYVYPGEPVTLFVRPGQTVYLYSYADPGYRVLSWLGTDDDTVNVDYNTVTMYGDRMVTLSFEKTYVRTFNIPGNYTWTQLQQAINDARDGDTIVLGSGTYSGSGIMISGKNIVLTSAFPSNPECVASTVLDFAMVSNSNLWVRGSGNGSCVINGITIANARATISNAPGPQGDGAHGNDGTTWFGGGLIVEGDHIIANCVIRDCSIYGSDGSNGNNGDTEDRLNGGNGGNGGSVGGAGLYIGNSLYDMDIVNGMYYTSTASPLIKNCTITGCYAEAGDGGNGGNGPEGVRAGEGGVPGRVFGAGVFCDVGTNPTFVDCTITNNTAVGGLGGNGGDETHNRSLRPGWGGLTDEWEPYAADDPDDPTVYHAGDPRKYTAAGGGVYVGGVGYGFQYETLGYDPYAPYDPFEPYDPLEPTDPNYPLTHARFINCTIADNVTQGSISGLGGQSSSGGRLAPRDNYQIPSYGAGLYCAEDANTILIDCVVVNNRTEASSRQGEVPEYLDPDTYSASMYSGYGGGIAAVGSVEYNPLMTIRNSHIEGNFAPVGGGMYWHRAQMDITDSNVVENLAYNGGGLYFFDSINSIVARSLIQGNIADFDPLNPPDPATGIEAIYGAGGGIYGFTSDILLRDLQILDNLSTAAGGGVYLGGHPEALAPTLAIPVLENCLIARNSAFADGGGVSVNWYAEPIFANCTIADNVVTSQDGLGGGLYCAYDSNSIVTDSIIWGNYGALGSQIALITGGEYYPLPTSLDITHSVIFDYQDSEGSEFENPSDPAIREGFNFFALGPNNDGSTAPVDIGFEIKFYDVEYTSLYINNNGNVTLAAPWPNFTATDLTSAIGTPIIAPFFADVDTTGVDSDVVTYAYRAGSVNGHNAFAVNWIDVGYANGNSDLLNSFQLVLIERSDRNEGDFDIEFNYGRVEWETGDNDGGVGGLGGNSARVGFSAGTGVPGSYYEFEGSGVAGTFLDEDLETGLKHNRRNSRVSGRYVFSVVNGKPVLPGEAIYVEEGSVVYGWDAIAHAWDAVRNNVQDDPDFLTSYYYLGENSSAIDTGSALAAELGLDQYTTQADGALDIGIVDRGYHYMEGAPRYPLVVVVTERPEDPGIHGTVTPSEGMFVLGEELVLVAKPEPGYYLAGWYDSRDRLVSTSEEFEIVVDENNYFCVEFKQGRTINVSGGGTALSDAVTQASNGDILIVSPGVYTGGINPMGKELMIVSIDPNDVDTVAATVIDCGVGQRAFTFDSEEKKVVVHGFTIRGGGIPGQPGGAIYVGSKAAPVFKNIHISNSSVANANGGAIYIASQASPTFVRVTVDSSMSVNGNGGGAYIGPVSTPIFTDCAFTNCSALGGSGGAVFCSISSLPQFVDCVFEDNVAGIAGGAVYFNLSCESSITRCEFISNMVTGGTGPTDPNGGTGGTGTMAGHGGALYYEYENIVAVADCNFFDNSAAAGGAIFINEDSTGTMADSRMIGNVAAADGGALYLNGTLGMQVNNCAMVQNLALRGGGLFTTNGQANVLRGCSFRENLADIGIPGIGGLGYVGGYGGGVFVFAESLVIRDCAMSENNAGYSGGGIYLAGDPEILKDTVRPELVNCLVSLNVAGRTGGGVSCGWYVEPVMRHCTIADNGAIYYGGGVVVAYDGQADISDSIIWGNFARNGAQIAVVFDNEFNPAKTVGNVSRSDVGPAIDPDLLPETPAPQLVITPMAGAQQLVDTLVGEGITIVGTPTFRGAPVAAGTFTGGLSAGIGIESGVILTTGDATFAAAPNDSDAISRANNYPGDTDLDILIGVPLVTEDATVLEFDFETRGGRVFLNYVFASDEYNEYARYFNNDTVAFFLDGRNIAVVPGTRTPVSVNSINGGNPLGFFAQNPDLYINNDLSDGGPFYNIEYDGFTVVLTATAANLEPGVHHMKLVIADSFNSLRDSAVFIQAGSLADTPTYGLPVFVDNDCILNGRDFYRRDAGGNLILDGAGRPIFEFDPVTFAWEADDFVIAADPLFVGADWLYGGDDPLLFVGGYMLSHIAAGEAADSDCIDIGSMSAEDAGLAGYTTRTDLVTDSGVVDLGYHYKPFEVALYALDVEVDEGIAGGPFGTVTFSPEPVGYDWQTGVPLFVAGTEVTVTAVPNAGYRVREWIGVDDSPAWQAPSTLLLIDMDMTIGVRFEPDVTRHLLVPTVYPTIEAAVAAASPGDYIILDPGEYTISNPDGINFQGRNLTIMSVDPDDPDTIAATVINCQGSRFVSKRAFHFFNGEDSRSRIYGITIKNGYAFAMRGVDGGILPTDMWPGEIGPNYEPGGDPPTVFRAAYGGDAFGDGYGGAVLCENGSSPVFENVVFYNNMVTGAQGGDGANGSQARFNRNGDSQPGGHGGDGVGNGYGGAIACLQRSNPTIINCTFENNTARGGMGGNGGHAGPSAGGHENCGGDGGDSVGYGNGGAIYIGDGCIPVISDCTFIDNNAIEGLAGSGGRMASGTAWGRGPSGIDWVASDGANGSATTLDRVWGGAIYCASYAVANITNCRFVNNRAFESYPRYDVRIYVTEPEVDPMYVDTRGGAIYAEQDTTVTVTGSDFEENFPGAIYVHSRSRVDLDRCTFIDNANPGNELVGVVSSPYYGYAYDYVGTPVYTSPETPGGALYLGPQSSAVNVTDCEFRGNYSYGHGGAVVCKTDATFTNCVFGGNIGQGHGGAFYGYEDIDPNTIAISLEFANCSFMDNESTYGGSLYLRDYDAMFDSCYLFANMARKGGAIYLSNGTAMFDSGIMRGNHAESDYALGGAVACISTTARFENFAFEDNSVEGDEAYGGAIAFYGDDKLLTQIVKNCLFTGNRSSHSGGALSCSLFMEAMVDNCTFDNNDAGLFGGALFCDWSSHPVINNSIFTANGHPALYEEQIGGDSQVTFSLFHANPDGDIYDAATGSAYTGSAAINTVNNNHDNIDGDPLFEAGPLGNYYLAADSPAVDRGSATSGALGLDTRTTRTDNAHDVGVVDLGYHYADIADLPAFQLTVSIVGGSGTVTPTSGTYYWGQAVTITAVPSPSYILKAWGGGTLNDNSRETTNIVIMDKDKHITVEFGRPKTLVVGSQGKYTSIQAAIDDAEDGDIVLLQTGEYIPPYPFDLLNFWNKDITLSSMNPDDPHIVANTVLQGYDFAFTNVGPGTIIEGFTITLSRMNLYNSSPKIRNCNFVECNWIGASGATVQGADGSDGTSVFGGAIEMYNSSPEITNCTFDRCSVTGGDGADGPNGNASHPQGWDGGWAGRAYGGAVYAAWYSNPVFRNCTFTNCFARGGNGGNGGDGIVVNNVQWEGGRGGNWLYAPSIEQDPFIWYFWDGWEWGDKFGPYGWLYYSGGYSGWIDTDDEWYQEYVYDPFDAYYDYWKYTGLGGAFYCEAHSSPKFYNCVFDNNASYGGDCGVGGGPYAIPGPTRPMDIETAGGAIYIGDGCSPLFEDCVITNNTADMTTVESVSVIEGPDDVYVSFGGGVAFEDGAKPRFVRCEISHNQACEGGGVYWANAEAMIEDCNVVGNAAYHGGGMYSTHGSGQITRTFFTSNYASVIPAAPDPGDPDAGGTIDVTYAHTVFGRGGGYYSLSSLVEISDSIFRGNIARASGGGIFFVGSDEDNVASPVLRNSLIVDNSAARDGGGITIDWFADPQILNCTIADNIVTGTLGAGFGYGGGVSVSYNSSAYISDSIIWNNAGANGAQIAVGSGDPNGPRPSEVTIVHTDIGPPYDPNATNEYLGVDDIIPDDTGGGTGAAQSSGGGAKLIDGDTLFGQFDQGQERVRVIVTLADFSALRQSTDWSSQASRGVLQQAISDRVDSVLNSLDHGELLLSQRYRNIPGFAGEITRSGLNKLLANPLVAHVEPDRMTHPMLAQGLDLINALLVRDVHDGSGVAIAVTDTGIDYNHPMLGGGGFPNLKVIGGYDTGDNDPDPIPNGEAHGTCCAGIAAGNYGVDGDYIGGVAYNAKLYALKISFLDTGSAYDSASIAAWDWCITHQYDDPANPILVISHSFGGGRYFSPEEAENDRPAFAAAARAVVEAGITPLAASGNEYNPDSLAAPAAFSSVISVGAVYDTTDQVIPYSNTAYFLDILAPSEPAYTTDIVGAAGYDPGNYFPYFNGTSAACPYAAGAVASIQHAAASILGRTLLPVEVRNLLIATGVPITDTKAPITKPRINLAAAIAGLSASFPIYVEEGCILHGWDPNSQEWDPDTFNFMEDPLFVGDYFLSEKAAKQLKDSPCVPDLWQGQYVSSRTAVEAGLSGYTTRTDSVLDDGMVNLGFHHLPFVPEKHKLNFVVIVDPIDLPGFEPEIIPYIPDGQLYDYGTQVELIVSPPPFGFHCVWKGTDDDARHEPNNVVTMDSDKIVTVTFESIGYRLDVEVLTDHVDLPPDFTAEITLDPPGGVYYPNTEVTITVTPPPPGFQVRWEGTEDNTVVEPVNTVVVNMDKLVTASYVPIQSDYYAVVIGISNYFDATLPAIELPYASHDAREFAIRLRESPNWDERNIYTLIDSRATKAEIRNILSELAGRLDHDDVLVFYFSGYGFKDVDIEPIDEIDELDEYLITYEWDGIRDDELGQMLADFATDNYVVILESDFAGGHIDGLSSSPLGMYNLSQPLRLTNTIPTSTALSFDSDDALGEQQDLNRNNAGVVITACGANEYAFYSDNFRHGVFTHYLLRALEGRGDWDGNDNLWVSAEECYQYLVGSVNAYIMDMVSLGYLPVGTRQRPRMYDADASNEIDLVVAKPQDSEPKTWFVPGDASGIQTAIDMARDGDVIVLGAGVYNEGAIVIDKGVTITSTNPDDPDVVAATVIDVSSLEADYAVYFTSNAGQDAVLNGITITGNGWVRYVFSSTDGAPGDDIYSAGVIVGTRAAPTIKNCVIRDLEIRAGRGGDGDEDDTNLFNGNGGDGGHAYGGGVYCMQESTPTFVNTTITGCHIYGGDGGNGAEANEYNFGGGRGGWGGWARGGGVYVDELAKPVFIHCTISDCSATGGNGGNGGDGGVVDGLALPPGYGGSWNDDVYMTWEFLGYEGDYSLYSAYGGGIYCASESEVRFVDCTISGNTTQGGISGVGGEVSGGAILPGMVVSGGRIYPFEAYEIPTHGGGLYCAPDSVVHLEGCTIADNVAPRPSATPTIDPELGYGGGAAFEKTASVSLIDCFITGNEASIGGGIYWYGNTLVAEDCNFLSNLAFNGGGLYGMSGEATITGGFVHRNLAGATDTDPVDVVGRGGGIYLASVAADVRNVEIFANQASASGGALFLTGTEPLTSTIKNCLLNNNKAGRDGGGLSVNWFAKAAISNCTFVENWATGHFGFVDPGIGPDPNALPDPDQIGEIVFTSLGGGLYCGYHSNVEIVDSIFWRNLASGGRQIAVGTGFEYDPRPSSLKIAFSDVQGGRAEPHMMVEEGCTLDWGQGNILVDPLFTEGPLGNFYLSQRAAGQSVQSPCVDAGSVLAADVGMNLRTTRADDLLYNFDIGQVDMGYHYPLGISMAPCKICDLEMDGIVNIHDLAVLAGEWFNECTNPVWCGGADINTDRRVDFADIMLFAACWLAEDVLPPEPNPTEWDIEPTALAGTTNAIEMSVKVSSDAWWGDQVEYMFYCVSDGTSSGWRQNYDPQAPGYVANPQYFSRSGLSSNQSYTYIAFVRDLRGNTTDPTAERSGQPATEKNPPVYRAEEYPTMPEQLRTVTQWDVPPYPISATALRMVALVPYDESPPITYRFLQTDAQGGAVANPLDLPPQTDPVLVVDGLTPNVMYYFTVTAVDRYGNEMLRSVVAGAAPDPALADVTPPPTPTWLDPPAQAKVGPEADAYWHVMRVNPVADPEGNGEEYFFDCLDNDSYDSGWIGPQTVRVEGIDFPVQDPPLTPQPNEYYVHVGISGLKYRYRVWVRDSLGNVNPVPTPAMETAVVP